MKAIDMTQNPAAPSLKGPSQKSQYEPPVMGLTPSIHLTATVRDTDLGIYTQVGANTVMFESSMDDYSYIVQNCQVMWSSIGKFTSIASNVRLNPGNHPTWRPTQHHFTYRCQSYGFNRPDDSRFFEWRKSSWVTVGHDVWIGHNATILPGVTVGNGAVIAAGAVVSKDVEPYTIVGGVPSAPIRRRFEPEVADLVQRVAWWDWPRERIELEFDLLTDMDRFVEKYG